MIKAYWNGFEVLEVRAFNTSKWGRTVQVAVYSTMHPDLMWVGLDDIELREVKND